VLLCPTIGFFLSNLSLAVLPAELQTTALPAFAVFIGLLGGQYVSNHAAFSALADVTRDESSEVRSSAFGMVEGAIWVGLLFGPTVGGMIANVIGDQPTFYVPAFISALNFLVTFFGFPETLDETRRKPIEWKRANPLAALSMYAERRVTLLFGVMTLFALAALTGGSATLALYAQAVDQMSTLEIGLLSSTVLGSAFVGLLVIMPLLLKCISLPKMMLISQSNAAVCWLFISTSDQTWQLFVGGSAMLTNACFFPIVRTGFCNVFGELRYGEALAAVGVVEQLASLLGSPIFNSIYAASGHTTLGPIQCPAMLCAAGFCFVAVLATLCVRTFPTGPAKEEHLDAKSSCVCEPPLLDPKEAAV